MTVPSNARPGSPGQQYARASGHETSPRSSTRRVHSRQKKAHSWFQARWQNSRVPNGAARLGLWGALNRRQGPSLVIRLDAAPPDQGRLSYELGKPE